MNPVNRWLGQILPATFLIGCFLLSGPWVQNCLGVSFRSQKTAPAPPWLQLSAVAEEMRINGLPAKVWVFSSNRSPEKILSFYRDLWQPGGTGNEGIREADIFPWKILSHLQGKLLYTVQVRENGSLGASGYVALSNMAVTAGSHTGPEVPALPGSQIMNNTWTKDGAQTGDTILLINNGTPLENSLFYKTHFSDLGWKNEMEQTEQGAEVLIFRHGRQEAHIVLKPSNNRTWVTLQLRNY